MRDHLASASYAQIEQCELDYHVQNILGWLTRCFLCRIYDDDLGPDYLFADFLENNYWPELVHEEWIDALYWDMQALIDQCLPGWSTRHQYPGRLAIPTGQIVFTPHGHVQILGDEETLTKLLRRDGVH